MSDKSPYWFLAKRYGWGWGGHSNRVARLGRPHCVLLSLDCWRIMVASLGQVAFVLYTALLCAVLIAVCWVKGEPPGWHWGGK